MRACYDLGLRGWRHVLYGAGVYLVIGLVAGGVGYLLGQLFS